MVTRAVATIACGLALHACRQQPSEPPPEPAAPAAEPAAPAPAPAAPGHEQHAPAAAPAAELPAIPAGAKVFFKEPAEGAKLVGPLENGTIAVGVKMGAEGIAVKPAGPIEAGSGHHHVLIDGAPLAPGTIVPKDERNLHYGQGQTEAVVPLAPGEHSLTLQFADGIHRSYGPALAATIKVTVAPQGSVQAAAKQTAPK
jgi:hypothetical protein